MRPCAKNKLTQGSALLLSMLLAFEPAAYAQHEGQTTTSPESTSAQARHTFSQQELDQMLAPVALYPDTLLSQVLMAATYPLEVVEAARWSRSNPNLKGDDAVKAVEQMDWDPSVKSLVAFPHLLQVMDEKLDWTERLGDAFLAQQTQVTDTVQNLRQKAYAAGTLKSNDQIHVKADGQIIVVEPANPEIIYVPYYDPFVFYGPWWWPDYPPIYWAPWPGYYFAPGYAPGFAWGIGIIITAGFFFGDFDWHHHRVHVVNVNNYYYGGISHVDRPGRRIVNAAPGDWRHDPDHRRGVPYREPSLRQQYGRTAASPEARRNYRGYDQPSFEERGRLENRAENRPENRPKNRQGIIGAGAPPSPQERRGLGGSADGGLGGRHDRPAAEPRSSAGTGLMNRPNERDSQFQSSAPKLFSRSAPDVRPPALEDIGRGQNVRIYSSRGRASHEGGIRGPGITPPMQQPFGSSQRGGMRQPRRQDH